jgi:hypothetical protein
MAARTQNLGRKKSAPPIAPEPTDETREQKFKRLGQKRVTRALNSVRLVKNLGSPNYAASDDDKLRILAALEEAVDEVRSTFLRKKGKQTLAFSFGETETAH